MMMISVTCFLIYSPSLCPLIIIYCVLWCCWWCDGDGIYCSVWPISFIIVIVLFIIIPHYCIPHLIILQWLFESPICPHCPSPYPWPWKSSWRRLIRATWWKSIQKLWLTPIVYSVNMISPLPSPIDPQPCPHGWCSGREGDGDGGGGGWGREAFSGDIVCPCIVTPSPPPQPWPPSSGPLTPSLPPAPSPYYLPLLVWCWSLVRVSDVLLLFPAQWPTSHVGGMVTVSPFPSPPPSQPLLHSHTFVGNHLHCYYVWRWCRCPFPPDDRQAGRAWWQAWVGTRWVQWVVKARSLTSFIYGWVFSTGGQPLPLPLCPTFGPEIPPHIHCDIHTFPHCIGPHSRWWAWKINVTLCGWWVERQVGPHCYPIALWPFHSPLLCYIQAR